MANKKADPFITGTKCVILRKTQKNSLIYKTRREINHQNVFKLASEQYLKRGVCYFALDANFIHKLCDNVREYK